MMVVGIVVEEISNINKNVSKSLQLEIQAKVIRSRYLPSHYIKKKHYRSRSLDLGT